jgi:translation initiation factor IF-3
MALRPNNNFRGPKREEELYRINNLIKGVPQVRLVGENIEQGIVDFSVAIAMAEKQGLDLVEISPKAEPPVCRVIDYAKFKYEQKKKQKEIKANASKTVLKEIRFSPNTDDHDFNFKLKHAIGFLKEGSKVKAYVHFVGRAIVFKDRGELLLMNFAKGLEEFGKPDEMPRLEGKRMSIMFSPKNAPKK